MIPIHYIARRKEREGWWQVRVYSVIAHNQQAEPKGFMTRHAVLLLGADYPEEPADVSALLRPLPDFAQKVDSELIAGETSFDNITIRFAPHVLLRDLVRAARDLGTEVWVEVTLEQMVTDCPPLRPHELVWPRKSRLVFWGRLMRKDLNYDVDDEKWLTDLNADPKVMKHAGDLEMQIAHWFPLYTNRSAAPFLDQYRAPYAGMAANTYVPVSDLLYKLTMACVPISLVAIGDKDLLAKDALVDTDESVTRCNFETPMTFTGGAISSKNLWNLRIRIRRQDAVFPPPGFWSGLFVKKGDAANIDPPQWSLYERWSSLGEAFALLCKEFFLKAQIELPTFREIWDNAPPGNSYHTISNVESNREWKWPLAARVLFLDVDDAPLAVATRAKRETVKTNPAAAWIKSVRVEEPADSNMDTGLWQAAHRWDYPQNQNLVIDDAGVEVSYTTLFGTVRKQWTLAGGTWSYVDTPIGSELYLFDVNNPMAPVFVQSVSGLAPGISILGGYWAFLHANRTAYLWASPHALLEWEQDGAWIEAFGAESERCLTKPEGTFGMGDWGEFPMLRLKAASPGVLFPEGIAGAFAVFELSRAPGGRAKFRSIERSMIAADTFVPPVDPGEPPPPPPPPNDDPPDITIDSNLTGAQSGVILLAMTATDDYGVRRVKMYVNGVFVGNATQGSGNAWSYSWNTALHPDGVVLLQARAEDESLQFGYASKIVTIDNP